MGEIVKVVAFLAFAAAVGTLIVMNEVLSHRSENHIRDYARKGGKKVVSITPLGPFSKTKQGVSNVQHAYEVVLSNHYEELETICAVYGDYYVGSFKDEIRYFRI